MNEMALLCERLGADIDARAPRRRLRPAHRPAVPVPGRRLRRLLLPQGRLRHPLMAEQRGKRAADLRGRPPGERGQKEVLFGKVVHHFDGELAGKTIARVGPRLQAAHRRHPRGARAARSSTQLLAGGRQVRAHDPEAMQRARGLTATASRSATSPTTRSRAPTRWCSSPSGTSSAARTSTHQGVLRTPIIFDGRNVYAGFGLREDGLHVLRHRRPRVGAAVRVSRRPLPSGRPS